MKMNRLWTLGVGGVAIAVVLSLGIDQFISEPPPLPLNEFLAAASAYVKDQQAAGKPLPAAVSLDELAAGGYLDLDCARSFAGTEVSLSLDPNPGPPQAVRMRVKLVDGYELALFQDGSVQGRESRQVNGRPQ